jgi:hypothetical protein
MTTPETLYAKNAVNEYSFPLVTHTACLNRQFGCYGLLMLGSGAGQILDGLM